MSTCEHEPSFTLTGGYEFVGRLICPCLKCGVLVEFPPKDKLRLRVVPDLPAAPTTDDGSPSSPDPDSGRVA